MLDELSAEAKNEVEAIIKAVLDGCVNHPEGKTLGPDLVALAQRVGTVLGDVLPPLLPRLVRLFYRS